MKNNLAKTDVVYLLPGQIFEGSGETLVSTVLGSCISLSMFSKKYKYGIITHCMLPECNKKTECKEKCTEAFKYVNCTVEQMLEKFENRNIKLKDIEVKIFGGSSMSKRPENLKDMFSVGRLNIETAMNAVGKYKLNLVSSDVGGNKGRKIIFNAKTGEIFVRK